MSKASYTSWRDEWSTQATARFELMRAAFVAQHGGEMFRVHSYDRALFATPRLSFTFHSAWLEEYFPQCVAAWDVNPELREWQNYSLTIATMAPGDWMWYRYRHQYENNTTNLRRLPKNGDFRDVVRAGVDNGFHELVAHLLVPNPNGSKPGKPFTLARRSPLTEHKIAVEIDVRTGGQRRASWNQMEHTQPVSTVKRHTIRSVYALYSVQAERWCVVR